MCLIIYSRYVKRIEYEQDGKVGTLTTSTDIEIQHYIDNFNTVVRCNAKKGVYILPVHGADANNGSITVHQVKSDCIVVRVYKHVSESGTFTFDLYYTKS